MFKPLALTGAAVIALALYGCSASGPVLQAGLSVAAPVISGAETKACGNLTKSASADTLCLDAAGALVTVSEAAVKGALAE
jgi:hypothetical protein